MDTGTPASGTTAADDALVALRAASARVAETASVAGGATDDDDHAFDAADHATRFEELHEALAAVLDELDRA